ncbi:holine Receptor [Brachionus plicatilis]|uniref:Holine Receptor n=1 Tax=Brachionus plicatilis TaxID=10195 RepID=A0A3M7RLC4_BRAPC|nr:holine Receptor [Brachionus plicatilis]
MTNILNHFGFYLFLHLTTYFFFVNSLSEIDSLEYKLFDDLTKNYSKNVRPVKNWNDTLDVFINVELKKIANVAEYHQSILIYVQLEMIWNDAYLTWDPSSYGSINSIMLPLDKIWIPDLHLFNSAAENDRIYPSIVQVFSNGTVKAYPINQLYAHCAFDFDHFPFDTQTCDFMIGNVVEKSKVKIWLTSAVKKDYLIPNYEWNFISLKDRPEFELSVPGTLDQNDWFSNDWSVSMFTLGNWKHSFLFFY